MMALLAEYQIPEQVPDVPSGPDGPSFPTTPADPTMPEGDPAQG
jgi:hypothetical protein